jgi:hypothetical protein
LLIIQRSGVWMPRYAQVGSRATTVFIADVAFANITGQHENFVRGMKDARLTETHVALIRRARASGALGFMLRRDHVSHLQPALFARLPGA